MRSSFKNDFDAIWKHANKGLERLIFVNILIFVIIIAGDLLFKKWGGISPWFSLPTTDIDFMYRPWTFFTSFFTHIDFFGLAFNMFWLYFFGKIFNDLLGSEKLVALYIFSGVTINIATLMLIYFFPSISRHIPAYLFGASSSILAILTATTTVTPDYRIHLVLIGPVRIKHLFFIALAITVFPVLGNKSAVIEFLPFLGIAIGYVYIKYLRKGIDLGQWITNCIHNIYQFFGTKRNLKVTYNKFKEKEIKKKYSTILIKKNRKPSQQEVDMILDKIHNSGYDSLTKEEKELLYNAKD